MKLQKHDNKGLQDSIKKPTSYQINVVKLKIALTIILIFCLLILIAKISGGFKEEVIWGYYLLLFGAPSVLLAIMSLFCHDEKHPYGDPSPGVSKFIVGYLIEKQKKALRKKAVLQAEEKPEVNITKAEPHRRDIKDSDSDDEWSNF